jgi:hypothetical protein
MSQFSVDLAVFRLRVEPTVRQNPSKLDDYGRDGGRGANLNAALSPDGTRIVLFKADGTYHRQRVERGAAQPLILPQRPDVFRTEWAANARPSGSGRAR